MRIRTIKPQFWKDDKVSGLDYFTRLLFIGLWNYVDDNGVGLDDEAVIAGELFPRDLYEHPDDIRVHVHDGLAALAKLGQIERYSYDGHRVLFITHWDEHQRISRPAKCMYKRPDELHAIASTETDAEQVEQSVHVNDCKLHADACNLHANDCNLHVGRGKGKGSGIGSGSGKGKGDDSPRDDKPGMNETETYSSDFLKFWAVYPWQCDQPQAYEEFKKALRKTNFAYIIAGASSYAYQQQQPGAAYTTKPANWLRNEGWNNKPQPAKRQLTRTDRAKSEWEQDAAIYRELKAEEASNAVAS